MYSAKFIPCTIVLAFSSVPGKGIVPLLTKQEKAKTKPKQSWFSYMKEKEGN
jgi:hypothetical protein